MPGCQFYKERCKLSNQYQIRLTLAFIFRLFIYVLIVTFLYEKKTDLKYFKTPFIVIKVILEVTDSKSRENARFSYVRKIWHLFPSLEHSSTKSTEIVNLYTSPFLSISTDECNLLVGQTAPSGYLSAYYGGMKKVGIVNWCKVKDSAHIMIFIRRTIFSILESAS